MKFYRLPLEGTADAVAISWLGEAETDEVEANKFFSAEKLWESVHLIRMPGHRPYPLKGKALSRYIHIALTREKLPFHQGFLVEPINSLKN